MIIVGQHGHKIAETQAIVKHKNTVIGAILLHLSDALKARCYGFAQAVVTAYRVASVRRTQSPLLLRSWVAPQHICLVASVRRTQNLLLHG